jgi:hypothetical protein
LHVGFKLCPVLLLAGSILARSMTGMPIVNTIIAGLIFWGEGSVEMTTDDCQRVAALHAPLIDVDTRAKSTGGSDLQARGTVSAKADSDAAGLRRLTRSGAREDYRSVDSSQPGRARGRRNWPQVCQVGCPVAGYA